MDPDRILLRVHSCSFVDKRCFHLRGSAFICGEADRLPPTNFSSAATALSPRGRAHLSAGRPLASASAPTPRVGSSLGLASPFADLFWPPTHPTPPTAAPPPAATARRPCACSAAPSAAHEPHSFSAPAEPSQKSFHPHDAPPSVRVPHIPKQGPIAAYPLHEERRARMIAAAESIAEGVC
jgi:hypothetical protein